MGAAVGGGRVSAAPPLENTPIPQKNYITIERAIFLHVEAICFLYEDLFHHVGSLFVSLYGPFSGLPPPPLQKFLRTPMFSCKVECVIQLCYTHQLFKEGKSIQCYLISITNLRPLLLKSLDSNNPPLSFHSICASTINSLNHKTV